MRDYYSMEEVNEKELGLCLALTENANVLIESIKQKEITRSTAVAQYNNLTNIFYLLNSYRLSYAHITSYNDPEEFMVLGSKLYECNELISKTWGNLDSILTKIIEDLKSQGMGHIHISRGSGNNLQILNTLTNTVLYEEDLDLDSFTADSLEEYIQITVLNSI
jgi:hypothetical protein